MIFLTALRPLSRACPGSRHQLVHVEATYIPFGACKWHDGFNDGGCDGGDSRGSGKPWMWISGAILGVAVMYNRVYLGARWVLDTAAGALPGAGFTLLPWAMAKDTCHTGNILPR